jgi:hypothetical protein
LGSLGFGAMVLAKVLSLTPLGFKPDVLYAFGAGADAVAFFSWRLPKVYAGDRILFDSFMEIFPNNEGKDSAAGPGPWNSAAIGPLLFVGVHEPLCPPMLEVIGFCYSKYIILLMRISRQFIQDSIFNVLNVVRRNVPK